MKKTFRFIASLALVLSLVLGLGCSAFAESSITYEGGAEKFVFLPGSYYAGTDLFENFKGVMPGDAVTQEIKVKNNFFGPGPVRIYMRAIAHDDVNNPLSPNVAAEETVGSMYDFLSQLHMEVYAGSKLIYSAAANELDGLRNNVLLGTFYRGQSKTLTVTLYVPITLGNEYANRVGEIDWVFTAEEIQPGDSPRTGDESRILLWSAVMLLSLASASAIFIVMRKKKNKH